MSYSTALTLITANRIVSFLKPLTQALLASTIIAIAAHMQIALQPVPVTLQDMAVIMISMILGPRLATLSVALYLLEGALGLPVFASGGPATLIGAHAGYAWGFLPAAYLSGYLIKRFNGKAWLSIPLAASAGFGIILLSGMTLLTTLVGCPTAIALGLEPFVLGTILKLIFLCSVMIPLHNGPLNQRS